MQNLNVTDTEYICDIPAPCLQLLLPEEIELVRASKTQVMFRKDDNLTKQGAFASYILFIIKGIAKQYIEGNGTKNYNLRIIKPGEFVGLSSVFTKQTLNYSSIAITDCQVILIENTVIEKLVKNNGLFGFNIIKRYCEQNANLFETVRSILYKQMNGHLADTLLYLDSFKSEFPEIFQLLSRKDIADFAGISTESAVKLLKNFERDGLIKLNEKDIQLLNKDSLIQIGQKG